MPRDGNTTKIASPREMCQGLGLLFAQSCDTGSPLAAGPVLAQLQGVLFTRQTVHKQCLLQAAGLCAPAPRANGGQLLRGWPAALRPALPATCSQLPDKAPPPSGATCDLGVSTCRPCHSTLCPAVLTDPGSQAKGRALCRGLNGSAGTTDSGSWRLVCSRRVPPPHR